MTAVEEEDDEVEEDVELCEMLLLLLGVDDKLEEDPGLLELELDVIGTPTAPAAA